MASNNHHHQPRFRSIPPRLSLYFSATNRSLLNRIHSLGSNGKRSLAFAFTCCHACPCLVKASERCRTTWTALFNAAMIGTRWLSGSTASPQVTTTSHETPSVVRINPLFWDDEENDENYSSKLEASFTTSQNNKKCQVILYWNPVYVAQVALGGVSVSRIRFAPLNSEDRSWTSTTAALSLRSDVPHNLQHHDSDNDDAQSQRSSDIDVNMFDMVPGVPPSPLPRITKVVELHTPIAHELHEQIIKELSQKLAMNKERCILSSVISKSERFNSIRKGAAEVNFVHPSYTLEKDENVKTLIKKCTTQLDPSACPDKSVPVAKCDRQTSMTSIPSWMNLQEDQLATVTEVTPSGTKTFVTLSDTQSQQLLLPVLRELDNLLSNSKSLKTFKMKVRQAQEEMRMAEEGLPENQPGTSNCANFLQAGQRSHHRKRFVPRNRRRACQVGVAIFMLILFLAMLVGLSVCCSGKPPPE